MRKFTLAFLTLGVIFAFGFATPAHASGNDNSCHGHSCNDVTNTTHNQGGTGGNAMVHGSGNSRNLNLNRNVNLSASDATAAAGAFNQTKVRTDVRNTVNNTNRQGQFQGQGQQQGQVGIVRDGDVVDNSSVQVEGDDVRYDFPVAPAAPVFAGNCAQGISVQTHQFGGSAASSNPVCDYIAVSGAFIAAGERGEALRVIGKAEDAADWRFTFARIRNVLTLGLL